MDALGFMSHETGAVSISNDNYSCCVPFEALSEKKNTNNTPKQATDMKKSV